MKLSILFVFIVALVTAFAQPDPTIPSHVPPNFPGTNSRHGHEAAMILLTFSEQPQAIPQATFNYAFEELGNGPTAVFNRFWAYITTTLPPGDPGQVIAADQILAKINTKATNDNLVNILDEVFDPGHNAADRIERFRKYGEMLYKVSKKVDGRKVFTTFAADLNVPFGKVLGRIGDMMPQLNALGQPMSDIHIHNRWSVYWRARDKTSKGAQLLMNSIEDAGPAIRDKFLWRPHELTNAELKTVQASINRLGKSFAREVVKQATGHLTVLKAQVANVVKARSCFNAAVIT